MTALANIITLILNSISAKKGGIRLIENVRKNKRKEWEVRNGEY